MPADNHATLPRHPGPGAVLLVKTSSMGDVIHNLPVATDLRRQFPDVVIDWVVEESFADIPRLHPAVREVIPVAIRRWRKQFLARETWQELKAFRARVSGMRYDAVLDTQGLIKSGLITWASRGRRYGFARETAREPFATRFYDEMFAIPPSAHAVDRCRWLAAAAFDYDPPDAASLDYGIQAEPLTADWLGSEPYVVFLTATSRDDKLWAEQHWLQLAQALNAQGLRCVLPAGNAGERERASRLTNAMQAGVAAPPLGLNLLARLLAGARLVIGVDTGLTHLAAALGRPVIALFAASDPAETGVVAATPAINLGAHGRPPLPQDVLAATQTLLAA